MTIVPLVVGYFAIQWNRANFLGKSPEQIVAMGRERWTDIYSKKFGQEPTQVRNAEEKYGIALQNLNDRAISRLPRTRQIWFDSVRKSTTEFASHAHEIGSRVSGGGENWEKLGATILPDIEQAIADCIVDRPAPDVTPKSFHQHFQELDMVIGYKEVSLDRNSDQYEELQQHRLALGMKQAKLLNLLAIGRHSDSNRIQEFLLRKMEVAKGTESA